ncbi:MAG: M42 family metallopeptidase [Defluviitaleaceae bacterium]|nr:M42 family metallopeptidase [Defluviitaleaceae bacterium]
MKFDVDYFKQVLADVLAIDSPTGFCGAAVAHIKDIVGGLGYDSYITNKGNLVVDVKGASDKTVGISAHIDTLGLVVRAVKDDGTLSIITVGGVILPTLDGEYCKVYTRDGLVYTGTVLSNSPAGHVFDDAHSAKRDEKNMHIRLDIVSEDGKTYPDGDYIKSLGIMAGDFVCYDPKTVVYDNGFIKSRFLDDKAGVAIILAMLKHFKDANITPVHNICVVFSTYEEIGHGLSHLPNADKIDEFVAVDMGCIGDDLGGSEFAVSICGADSSGPYDYDLTTRLINLAKAAELNFAVDIYPYYGSDVSAARRAGHDIKGGLIGPGIAASHGMERTHISSCENAYKLLYLYLTQ